MLTQMRRRTRASPNHYIWAVSKRVLRRDLDALAVERAVSEYSQQFHCPAVVAVGLACMDAPGTTLRD
jgi:hypothetical protein